MGPDTAQVSALHGEHRGGFSRSAARGEAPGISSNPLPLFPSPTAKIFMSKVDIKI